MKICLIACPNGYGHSRRILLLSEYLLKKGFTIDLVGDFSFGLSRFVDDLNFNNVKFFPLPSFLNSKFWTTNLSFPYNSLPNLRNYDLVISDNLIEILEIRSDTVLSGSFFWHKVLPDVHPKKYSYCESLVDNYNPYVISSSLFSPPYISSLNHYVPVGLFPSNKVDLSFNLKRSSVLLSFGKGHSFSTSQINKILNFFITSIPSYLNVFIEPFLYKETLPQNFIPADYSQSMYANLCAAFIRPGVGTLTELISNHVFSYCFYEDNNKEMSFNAKIIEEHHLGLDSFHAEVALKHFLSSELFVNYSSLIKESFEKISLNGCEDSTNAILSIL